MRVALYARVSSDRQEKQRSIGSQIDALQARAVAEGWTVAQHGIDDGYSGATLDRPGLDQVRDAAAAGLIDAVVALCPDRLARNFLHQALVLDELARFGVSVMFIEGGLADDPHGRLVAQIQAAVAEFERTKILERNRRGKLWRARQGGVVTARPPYGYTTVPTSDGLPARLEIREDRAAVVRDIFDWHANDRLSIRKIAIRLIQTGVPTPTGKSHWSTSTLERLLRNPAYAGTLYYNRTTKTPDAARGPRHAPGHQPAVQLRPRRVDRRQRARHRRRRHLGPLPSPPRRELPLQRTPRRSRPLPTALPRPLRRVRTRPQRHLQEDGSRLHALLLLQRRRAPDAPPRTAPALHPTLRPRRRTRPTDLGRGRPAPPTPRADPQGRHHTRRPPRRPTRAPTPRATHPTPAPPRRLPGRRHLPARAQRPPSPARRPHRRTRPLNPTPPRAHPHQDRPQTTPRRLRRRRRPTAHHHDLPGPPTAPAIRARRSDPHRRPRRAEVQDSPPTRTKGGSKSPVTRERPIAFPPSSGDT